MSAKTAETHEVDIAEVFGHAMAVVEGFPDEVRTPVQKMLDGPVGEQFFLAPASSRRDFHSCYAGGLAEHSIGVIGVARELATALLGEQKTWPFPAWKLDFCALFHDLGKCGDGIHPFYVPTTVGWKMDRGQLYEIDPECLQMPTAERGLFILQGNGVPMDSDMYLGIRVSDGQYVPENEPFRLKEPRIALIVHFADYWRTLQEKGNPSG